MVISVKNQANKFELVMWLGSALLIATAISSHYYFSTHSLFLRVLAMIVAIALSAWLISKTKIGHTAVRLWHDSMLELRKVVWPTRKETLGSIAAVVVMAAVVGLLLGIMDWVLGKGLHWLLSGSGV